MVRSEPRRRPGAPGLHASFTRRTGDRVGRFTASRLLRCRCRSPTGLDRFDERRRDHRGGRSTGRRRRPRTRTCRSPRTSSSPTPTPASTPARRSSTTTSPATGLQRRRRRRGLPRRVAAGAARAARRAVVPDDQHRPVGALVRPHHPARRVRAAADEPQRPGLGQPRRAHGRRAERRVRVRQQLRQHRPPVRRCAASTGSGRASPSTSRGSCASCSPTTQAGTLPAGCFVKLYLGADRGLAGAPFGLPPTPRALDAYLELLEGTGLVWAVSAVGDDLTSLDVCRGRARRRRPPARRARVLRRRPPADERRARRRRRQGRRRRRPPRRHVRRGRGHPRPPPPPVPSECRAIEFGAVGPRHSMPRHSDGFSVIPTLG